MDQRPVSESFTTDYHGRDSVFDAALALDADGNFLAVKLDGLGNLGAYAAGFGAAVPTMVLQKSLASVYKTPLMAIDVKLVFTTTTPTTAYRGAGRPEAIYIMERLVDAAARETGRDPVALRRLNLIPADAMPFEAASGLTYDSGEFERHLDLALERANWAGFNTRKGAAKARGKLRGIGVTTYLEVTAPPGKEMGGVRFDASGTVTLVTGTLDYGQGHRAPFAQVLADRLGIPFEAIELLQGDSDQLLFGGGTGGSRSIMATGQAIEQVATKVIEQGKQLAADKLEAAPADIQFDSGDFVVAGTDRRVPLMELAKQSPAELSAELVADTPPSAFPNGTHIAEVEIDPDTGVVELIALHRHRRFRHHGEPAAWSRARCMAASSRASARCCSRTPPTTPTASCSPAASWTTPCPGPTTCPASSSASTRCRRRPTRSGVKGCGEAGVTAAPPTIVNAIIDALAPLGITDLDLPASPEKIWRAIQDARRAAA